MIRLDLVIFTMALGVSLLGYLPLLPFLEPFPKILLPLALLLTLALHRRRFRIDRRLLTAGSLAIFLFYLFRATQSDPVGPVVNLLVALLGVRFLGEQSSRNYLQIFLLSLFCLAASSLYSLDALFMLYLGLQVVIFQIALVLLTCYDRDPVAGLTRERFCSLLTIPLGMLLLSVPLLLCFFMILPRTPFPLWDFPANSAAKKSGFSETVQPGSAASVGENRGVAFRAECVRLPPAELYWRGITLNRVDGTVWSRREPPATERFVPGKGRLVSQRLFLEPGSTRYLVALDLPGKVFALPGVIRGGDFTLTRRSFTAKRSTYMVDSVMTDTAQGRLRAARGFYLETPERLHPWLRERGLRLRDRGGNDRERLAAVETFFRGEQLRYATTGLPHSEEPLLTFLTSSKRGNCEFFASSCALLLRLAGVPARLVGGYLGGEYSELGGYYLVTQDRAHVWVEAYLEGTGWVRVDPTRWAVNAGEVGSSAGQGGWSLSLAMDALTYFWNRQVITYDLERQIALYNEVGQRLQGVTLPEGKWVLLLLIPAIVPFLLRWGGLPLLRRSSREARLVTDFIAQLRRLYGIEATPDAGLREMTAGIESPDVGRFVELHNGALYRDRRLLPEELRELRGIISRMKRCLSPPDPPRRTEV